MSTSFVIINKNLILNLDHIREVRRSENGTSLAVIFNDGKVNFFHDTDAVTIWETICNQPSPIQGVFG